MTLEDKKLLIIDLCARLPYGVYVEHTSGFRGKLHDINVFQTYNDDDTVKDYLCHTSFFGDEVCKIENFKPYLFPLSNITKEQEDELDSLGIGYGEYAFHDDIYGRGIGVDEAYKFYEWCYKNHIDFLGLIPLGLAIDATGLNIY